MNLIINAFYSNKDVFLRELISNSSDALDKMKYQALTNQISNTSDLKIEIIPLNKEDKQQLLIRDTGCGMTKEELTNRLGTIANSGTKEFIEAFKQSMTDDMSLIGRFGVGFYSAYLVADKVDVYTKSFKEQKVYLWTSEAGSTFTIEESSKEMDVGTEIILTLKDNCKEYLDDKKLKEIIKKHSQFISYPIYLEVKKMKEKKLKKMKLK
ncbi:heat shock protein 83-like [Alosa alosa]|uniref:heat shock protein 83-like n=1 Tax=Alosa alosa TaxID=278164 RepID=UPI00201551EA|nr:heat shock protein 83-like [Alosa alosa]